MREERKIIICETCKGEGVIENEILVDAHRNEYEKIYPTCESCLGSGRQIEIIKRELKAYQTNIKPEVK